MTDNTVTIAGNVDCTTGLVAQRAHRWAWTLGRTGRRPTPPDLSAEAPNLRISSGP